jgi:hypothetical protein
MEASCPAHRWQWRACAGQPSPAAGSAAACTCAQHTAHYSRLVAMSCRSATSRQRGVDQNRDRTSQYFLLTLLFLKLGGPNFLIYYIFHEE